MKNQTSNIKCQKSIFSFCFVIVIFAFCNLNFVHAQQVNLSMSPPIVQTRIKPGKSIIIAYTVQNSGDPTNLQFLIRPFTPIGQLGSLTVSQQLEGPVQFNLENADAVLEKPFFFPSKEKRQAVLRIHIPPGVPDGDYYYMVMAETVPAFGVAGQSTGVASASIGSPLLISITESGVTEAKATIGEFSFIPDYTFTVGKNVVRIVDNAKELAIVCSVRNMGKNLIQPQGTITDQFGDTKNKYNIIPQNILSNSQRIIKTFSDENLDKAGSTLILSPISAGNHRVTAEMTFGENASVQYKTLEFLALPLRLIYISFFSLLIVLGLFVVRYIKRNTKH